MHNEKTNQLLTVVIRSPDKVVFDGKAVALTSYNDKGIFDVLPYHANFISIIKKSIVVYETMENKKTIALEKGVLRVFEDTVAIFLGVSSPH